MESIVGDVHACRRARSEELELGFDEVNRAAFIHIPKCGGTTVRTQLVNSGGWRYLNGMVQHPDLGLIFNDHVPLPFLRTYYPDEFNKLLSYDSFALVRDPHDRFASAIFQRIEAFGGVTRLRITKHHALAEAQSVMEWLKARDKFCDAEYILFSRQTDYIMLDGEQVIHHVYLMDDMQQFADHLERVTGMQFDADIKYNVNYASGQSKLFAFLYQFKPIYSRMTSWSFREKILRQLQRLKLVDSQPLYEEFRHHPVIREFVETYYAEDFGLVEAARTRAALRRAESDRTSRALAVG